MTHARIARNDWDGIIGRLQEVADLERTARQFKAFQRVGKVANAVGLLRLALMYGPGRLSLRGTAAAACGVVADISDKAVEGRLRRCGDWLQHLLECLLNDPARPAHRHVQALSLVDGSLICPPGSGGRWRLHASYDPGAGHFTDLRMTPATVAEGVSHTKIATGDTLITDRGYARVRDFRAVLDAGSDFITRIGWRSLCLRTMDAKRFDLMAAMPAGDDPVEHRVRVNGVDRPLRLVLQRLPQHKAASSRKRASRRSARSGHVLDARTLQAADYLMVLTSLPQTAQSAARVLELYRARWQVELSFKRLKSLGGIDALPAADPRLARTWLLAHLIVAVLTDDLANQIIGVPPWTQGNAATCIDLAGLANSPRHPAASHPA